MQKTKFALSIVSAAALLTLAACGGGGGDSAPTTQQPAAPTPPAPTITVQGSATVVQADPLAVVFVPHTEKATQPISVSWSIRQMTPANGRRMVKNWNHGSRMASSSRIVANDKIDKSGRIQHPPSSLIGNSTRSFTPRTGG